MTISDKIRQMAKGGLATADIAKKLGIRYQHAYNVLKADGVTRSPIAKSGARPVPVSKPALSVKELKKAGFGLAGRWRLSEDGNLTLDQKLPKSVGVYAFAKDGIVQYVGVATMGLAKRLYFYGKPGITQRTSQRINGVMKGELKKIDCIEIYAAFPEDMEWNGLPVHGSAGLELGLIKKFALPWNMRSAG